MRKPYQIVGPSNLGIAPEIDAQRSVNAYPHTDLITKKSALLGSPGLLEKLTSVESGGRAQFQHDDVMYAVIGDKFISYDSLLVETVEGTIGTASGYVGISANSVNEVIIVDGVDGYIWNSVASTFTKITAPGFPTEPTDVTFLDGYFLVTKADDNTYYVSDENDGNSWNALLDFAKYQGEGDNIVGCEMIKSRIFLFGEKNTEVLYNAGAKDFPFRAIGNESLDFGCAAIGSIKKGFSRLFWLARDRSGASSVVVSDGGTPSRISTDAVEYRISQYEHPEDAVSILYKQNGHLFYEISFTQDNETLVYDSTASQILQIPMWHEKMENDETRSRSNSHAFFLGQNFVTEYNGNGLYAMDDNYAFYGDDPITRIRIGEEIREPSGKKIRINKFQVFFRQGIGSSYGDSEDPKVLLSFSKDGGNTWSRRVAKKVGKIGEREYQTIWRALGSGYRWIPRLEYYQEGNFIITGAAIDYDILE